MKRLTQKEIEQIKIELSNKNIELKTIEYLDKQINDIKYTEIIINEIYLLTLRNGNNKWYQQKYTTKKETKKYLSILKENAIIEKIVL